MWDNEKSDGNIVISGVSGRFPKADDIDQLWEKLVNKERLYDPDDTPYPKVFTEPPKVRGAIRNPEHFDNEFFGYSEESADAMDGQLRLLHEVSFEAFWDAGVRPETWSGSKTGVFIASFGDDTDITARTKCDPPLPQCLPTRLSHFYNFKGPCVRVDAACASGLSALHLASLSIQNGDCDQAIVAGICLHQKPFLLPAFGDLGILSKSGISGCLDARADGYVRGEAVCAMIVQRKSQAKRIYCEIRGISSNTDGYTQEGITFPNRVAQVMAMNEALQRSGINPSEIKYIEGHITGTQAGDTTECSAIVDAYRREGTTDKPIYVGALKANIGHSEAASGLCAIAKVAKIFQTGILPPIVPFIPNPNIESLTKGLIRPVLYETAFNDDLIAVNSFGFGGANAHVILQACAKNESTDCNSEIPMRLIFLCNRKENGISKTWNLIETNPESRSNEFLSLLDHLSESSPESGMVYRSYGLLQPGGELRVEGIRNITKKRRLAIIFLKPVENQSFEEELPSFRHFDEFNSEIDALDEKTRKNLQNMKSTLALIELLKSLGIESDLVFGQSAGVNLAQHWTGQLMDEEVLLRVLNSTKLNQSSAPQDLTRICQRLQHFIGKGRLPSNSRTFSDENQLIWSSDQGLISLHPNPDEWDALVFSKTVYFQRLNVLAEPSESDCMESNESILHVLGSIFLSGHSISIEKLYSKVSYPVYRECPSISPLLEWEHSKKFTTDLYPEFFTSPNRTIHVIDLLSPEYSNLSGHVIDGQVLMPAAGFTYLIAKHLGMCCSKTTRQVGSFSFKLWDVKFSRALKIADEIELVVYHDRASKKFSIQSSLEVHVTGHAAIEVDQVGQKLEITSSSISFEHEPQSEAELNKAEIYQCLRVRGFTFHGKYEGIASCRINRSCGFIRYQDDWTAFMDSLLQMDIFWDKSKLPKIPTSFKVFRFDSKPFLKSIMESKRLNNRLIKVTSGSPGYISTPGLTFSRIGWTATRWHQASSRPRLANHRFFPFHNRVTLLTEEVLSISDFQERCYQALKTFPNQAEISSPKLLEALGGSDAEELLKFPGRAVNSICQSFVENLGASSCVNIGCFGQMPESLRRTLTNKNSELKKSTNILDSLALDQSGKPSNSLGDMDLIFYEHSSARLFPHPKAKGELGSISSELLESKRTDLFLLVQSRFGLNPLEHTVREKFGISDEEMGIELAEIYELERNGLICVAQTTIEELDMNFHLYRKPLKMNPQNIKTLSVTSRLYDWVEEVQKSLEDEGIQRLWLTDMEIHPTGILGLFNCLRLELSGSKLRCLMGPQNTRDESTISDHCKSIPADILQKDLRINIWRDGSWGNMVLEDIDIEKETRIQSEHYYAVCKKPGMLESLTMAENTTKYVDPKDLIRVHYASLNFRDVLIASGVVPLEAYPNEGCSDLGSDFSGIDAEGRKVIGAISGRSFSNYIDRKKVKFLIRIPDSWDLRDAATLPLCYLTAYYSLVIRGRIEKGEKILIHSGSGGVGLAAISLCISLGCKIFTTVSTAEKREFVQNMFPQLDDSVFFDSRSSTFEEDILLETNGKGVDIVLNSLTEDMLKAGLRCLAEGGRFIDLSKRDFLQDTPIETFALEGNKSYETVCLVFLLNSIENGIEAKDSFVATTKKLEQYFYDGIETGQIKPLPWKVFDKTQMEEAFRFMRKASHLGKLLIQMKEASDSSTINRSMCRKMTHFNSHKSYLIVGGLGGMGLELVYWMVSRGARKIVISSRSGIKTSYQKLCLQRVKDSVDDGVTILIDRNDLTTFNGSLDCIKRLAELGPPGGIFNLAVVLRDGPFNQQSSETFKTVCGPKVEITRNLDEITRKECPKLDHFVCFSSIASHGLLGQTNYAFANSTMERICEVRRLDGLPGLAVQWGPVGDVGIAVRIFGDETDSIAGYQSQSIHSCLETLDIFLGLPYPICYSAISSQDKLVVTSDIFTKITRVLGLKNLETIDHDKTLKELGLDSIQVLEIQLFLTNEAKMSINQTAIGQLTLNDVKKFSKVKRESEKEQASRLRSKREVLIPLNNKPGTEPIFFFPPAISDFEGIMPLVDRLDCQAIGVNSTELLLSTPTLKETSETIFQAIITNYPDVEKYFFVGYSLGASISFDVGRKIQAKYGVERMDRLLFIDASPVWHQRATSAYRDAKAALEAEGGKVDDLKYFLTGIGEDWADGILAESLELLPRIFRVENSKLLLEYYNSAQSVAELDLSVKFQGTIILILATNQPIRLNTISKGADQLVDGRVERHFLPSHHFAIVEQFPDEIVKVIKFHSSRESQ